MFKSIIEKLNKDSKELMHKLYANVCELEDGHVMVHTTSANVEFVEPHWTAKDGVMAYAIMTVGEFVDWLYEQHSKGYEIDLAEIN